MNVQKKLQATIDDFGERLLDRLMNSKAIRHL